MSLWPAPAHYQSYFSRSYAEARQCWLDRVRRSNWQHQAFSYPLHKAFAPDGSVLHTDGLWLGPADARRVLVLLSGTHGVEGYAGSAIQSYLLEGCIQEQLSLPAETAILFVHALTPWGMAWYRRCDEHGIDLNRNFIDFTDPPTNPGFRTIRPCLQISEPALRTQTLQTLAKTLGRRDYDIAVSAGQYVDALAPYYGGKAPAHGHRVVDTLICEHQLAQRELVVLDLHTGLGPWAYGELICDHPANSSGAQTAQGLFGPQVSHTELGTSSSVPKHGLLDYAWHRIMNAHSCFLTLEFGSYNTDELFTRVIEDHLQWRRSGKAALAAGEPLTTAAAMLEHFCPADPYWRAAVLWRALQVVRQALERS